MSLGAVVNAGSMRMRNGLLVWLRFERVVICFVSAERPRTRSSVEYNSQSVVGFLGIIIIIITGLAHVLLERTTAAYPEYRCHESILGIFRVYISVPVLSLVAFLSHGSTP